MNPIFTVVLVYTCLSYIFLELKAGVAVMPSKYPNAAYRKDSPVSYWFKILLQIIITILFGSLTDFNLLFNYTAEKYFGIAATLFFLTWFQVLCYYCYRNYIKKPQA